MTIKKIKRYELNQSEVYKALADWIEKYHVGEHLSVDAERIVLNCNFVKEDSCGSSKLKSLVIIEDASTY